MESPRWSRGLVRCCRYSSTCGVASGRRATASSPSGRPRAARRLEAGRVHGAGEDGAVGVQRHASQEAVPHPEPPETASHATAGDLEPRTGEGYGRGSPTFHKDVARQVSARFVPPGTIGRRRPRLRPAAALLETRGGVRHPRPPQGCLLDEGFDRGDQGDAVLSQPPRRQENHQRRRGRRGEHGPDLLRHLHPRRGDLHRGLDGASQDGKPEQHGGVHLVAPLLAWDTRVHHLGGRFVRQQARESAHIS